MIVSQHPTGERRRIFVALKLVLLFVFNNFCPASAAEGIAVVSGSPVYPPFSWQDRANQKVVVGIGVELTEKIFRKLGIPFEVKYGGPWRRVQRDAEAGDIDLVAGLFVNPDREKYLDFIYPAFMVEESVIFFMRDRAAEFKSWEDCVNKVGGGLLGDGSGSAFEKLIKNRSSNGRSLIEFVPTAEQLFKKLKAGRSQYVIYGLRAGLAYAEQEGLQGRVLYIPSGLPAKGMHLAFSKKSAFKKYKDQVGSFIVKYQEQKIIEKMEEKYMNAWKEQSPVNEAP